MYALTWYPEDLPTMLVGHIQHPRIIIVIGLLLLLSITPVRASSHLSPVTVTASSADAAGAAVNTVNDSGLGPCGLHSNVATDMWLAESLHGTNPRGGTVAGSHWIEFDLGQPYPLDHIDIWNYNAAGAAYLSVKGITIEGSLTGSTNPADWTTLHTGTVPQAQALGAGSSGVDLTIPLDHPTVRYVVFAVAIWPNHNYKPNTYGEVGLSEVRFYQWAAPADCSEAQERGYGYAADFNTDCYVDLLDFAILTQAWMWCVDPADPTCSHPWNQ